MKHLNKFIAILLVALLVVGIMPVSVFAAYENTPKEEVVYINLNADGSVKEINVVNIFDLDVDGKIIDYGKYESIRNMTTPDKLGYTNETVTVDAKAGKLYYEGKLSSKVMPWNIAINGIKLNLAIEIDDAVISEKINEIIAAVKDLDDGANELNTGAKDSYNGTNTLNDKVGELCTGVGALTTGTGDLANGLSTITSKNKELLDGAYEAFKGICSASETILNAELTKNGLPTVKLTPETYTAVLTQLLKTMDADAVYNMAFNKVLAEVTAQVEAQADALYAGYVEQNADAIYRAYIQPQADTLYAQVAAQAVLSS